MFNWSTHIFIHPCVWWIHKSRRTHILYKLNTAKPEGPRFTTPYYYSYFFELFFCFFGIFQFIPTIRKRSLSRHKTLGAVVVISGELSSLTDVWLAHYYDFPKELQGELLYWSRLIIGPLMALFIIQSLVVLRKKSFSSHGKYMLRAYAIAQGASTQTFFSILWGLLTVYKLEGNNRDILMLSSWFFNMILIELFIHKSYVLADSNT